MQIRNNTIQSQSLYHSCLFKCGLASDDTTAYPFKDFVREANDSLRKVNSWIWNNTGEWEYDDSNYDNFPIATRDLVDNQADYSLPLNVEKVDRCEILLKSGEWKKLSIFDKGQTDFAMSEFAGTKGEPIFYDLMGNSLILLPSPDLTKVEENQGLQLYFSREISEFSETDTTKEPGFAKNFHNIIALDAAISWCNIHDQSKLNQLYSEREVLKNNLEEFYSKRSRESRTSIRRKYNNNKRK